MDKRKAARGRGGAITKPKKRSAAASPKTVLEKLVFAIRLLKDAGGSSRQALAKATKSQFQLENANAFKQALKKGVEQGVLIKEGQRFSVAGDPEYEVPEEDRVAIETLNPGTDPSRVVDHGDMVSVAYVGKLMDGSQFDASSDFSFQVGAGEVIKGWDQGVLGMCLKEKRRIVCPPKLGYGAKGSAPDIPPHATLDFTVTLKAFQGT